jgi:hypothetical protein
VPHLFERLLRVAITLTANAAYGFHVTSGPERFVFAVGGACLDGIKDVLPIALAIVSVNQSKWGRLARGCGGWIFWAGLVAWSFFCAMQIYEQSRVGRVGQVEADKLAYQSNANDLTAANNRIEQLRVAKTKEAIQADIDAAKLDRLYDRSQQCTDANRAESRALCQKIAGLEGELAGAMTAAEIKEEIETEKAKAKEAKKGVNGTDLNEVVTVTDAGTQGLADMLHMPVEKLRQRLAFMFALLMEVAGGLGGMILNGGHLPAGGKNTLKTMLRPRRAAMMILHRIPSLLRTLSPCGCQRAAPSAREHGRSRRSAGRHSINGPRSMVTSPLIRKISGCR